MGGLISFSANLGFLWKDRPLPDAIHAARAEGFAAVECHWPYDIPASETAAALKATGLKMLGLNTNRGNLDAGENGVAALAGREAEARKYIDQALEYAKTINCANIHVMAGFTNKDAASKKAFADNLRYACKAAAPLGKTILIEPLNRYDAPGYHLSTLEQAIEILQDVAEANLKIMFDCYHLQIMGGDLLRRFKDAAPSVGHVQFASVPDRAEPDHGEVNFPWLLNEIANAGFNGPFGAEYKPRATTDDGLGWMKAYQA